MNLVGELDKYVDQDLKNVGNGIVYCQLGDSGIYVQDIGQGRAYSFKNLADLRRMEEICYKVGNYIDTLTITKKQGDSNDSRT